MIHGLTDRPLDERTVSRLAARLRPELTGKAVARFGQGWDNEVFAVGGEWLLRFPKRAEIVPWLRREIEIMEPVREALGTLVPSFELKGEPGPDFPYPFVGYRRLDGVAIDLLDRGPDLLLAEEIADVLGRLHRLPAGRMPSAPSVMNQGSTRSWAEVLADESERLRSLLPGEVADAARPYLTGATRDPAVDPPKVFTHGDLFPDHLLADPRTGRLSGVIDFADGSLAPATGDFVGLIGLGWDFVASVVDAYDLGLPAGFGEALAWKARMLSLCWMAEANDAAELEKYRRCVTEAFRPGPD